MASDMAGLHCLFQRSWFLVTLISSVTLRFYELLQVLHCDPLSSAGYWTGEGLALQTKLSWCFPHFSSSTLHIFKIYDQRNLWKWQYTNISGPKLLKFDPAPVFCVLQCVCTLQRLIDRCVRSKLLHAVESIIIVFIIFFFYNRPKHCKGGTGDLKVQRVTLCFENNSQMLVCILKHLFRFLPNVRHM